MNYLQFQFDVTSAERSGLLIALLSEAGFEGFEESDAGLKAFIQEPELDQGRLDEICSLASAAYRRSVIEEQNWNAQWESGFEPVIVNDLAAVRASFHQPVPGVKYELIITPKMSFGTGHHATTFMMIAQMGALDLSGKKVLDFGTGTGVLAILAEKMGAAEVMTIDNDDWSIENAQENVAANGCTKITVQKAGDISGRTAYDVLLANINLNVILANLGAIASAVRPGGEVLLSGFLKGDEAQLRESLQKQGLGKISIFQKGDWLCIYSQRQ